MWENQSVDAGEYKKIMINRRLNHGSFLPDMGEMTGMNFSHPTCLLYILSLGVYHTGIWETYVGQTREVFRVDGICEQSDNIDWCHAMLNGSWGERQKL